MLQFYGTAFQNFANLNAVFKVSIVGTSVLQSSDSLVKAVCLGLGLGHAIRSSCCLELGTPIVV